MNKLISGPSPFLRSFDPIENLNKMKNISESSDSLKSLDNDMHLSERKLENEMQPTQVSIESTPSVDPEKAENPVPKAIEEFGPDVEFDSGYSWVILFFATVICAFSYGPSGTYGVFLANFLHSKLFPAASTMDFAFVGGLQYGIGLMMSPVCIWLHQHIPDFNFGMPPIATSKSTAISSVVSSPWAILSINSPYKIVIIVGALAQGATYIGASFATKTWQLYLSQGVCSGIGICFVYVTANALIPQWFLKKRGMANGIFTAGAGIGSIIFSQAVQHLIQSAGLPWAQRFVGIFACAMCLISSFFMIDRRALFKRKVRIVSLKLLFRGDIWLALIWGTITMFCLGIDKYTLSPYGVHVGLTKQQASVLTTVLSVGIVVGRPLLGYLADLIGSINAALVSTFFTALFIFAWWIPSTTYSALIGYGFFVGFVFGSFAVGYPPIIASIVDLEDFDTMMSMSFGLIGIVTTFSTPCAIGLTTINGSYLYSQLFTGILNALSIFVLLCSRVIVMRRKNGEKGSFLKLYFKFTKV